MDDKNKRGLNIYDCGYLFTILLIEVSPLRRGLTGLAVAKTAVSLNL